MRREPLFKGRSIRTLYNDLYQGRAQQLLDRPEHEPWVRWLIDHEGTREGKRGSIKVTILSQLGRIENDAKLVAVAQFICERKPTARDAVRMIRMARRGHPPQGTVDHLAARIMALVQDYRYHHAEVDRDLLLDALQIVEDAVWEMKAP
jgi:hypothetical protein